LKVQQGAAPLGIDLFCGLGGWTEGLLSEGYYVVGFDNCRHVYGEHRYPAQLVIQDVLSLHGAQFKDAALIVASPPCQAYSYRAMPWKRAKALPPPDNSLFDACFRIQREASAAAGRHIPLIVENVRGAEKWVGRARWNFGSFYLWGDVPALMPMTKRVMKNTGGSWFGVSPRRGDAQDQNNPDGRKLPGQDWNKFKKTGEVSQWNYLNEKGLKTAAHLNQRDGHRSTSHLTNPAEHIKCGGLDLSQKGFNVQATERYGHLVEGADYRRSDDDKRQHIGVKRKFAAAMIAKIPLALARHIAAIYKPK
jgi:C-5 cytosine-specific DNA methylase